MIISILDCYRIEHYRDSDKDFCQSIEGKPSSCKYVGTVDRIRFLQKYSHFWTLYSILRVWQPELAKIR